MKSIFSGILITLIFQSCVTHRPGLSKQSMIREQVWVVTGASSGLGRGIALEAGKYHAKVAIASRNSDELKKIAQQINALGGEAIAIPTDISDSDAVKELMRQVLRQWGRVDVWVNNAGVTVLGNFWETPLREHERVIAVNLKGTLYGSYVALQQFQQQDHGKLINIASAESRIPTAYQATYAATKGALKNMGIVIRQELRLQGKARQIRVISVDPWALNTPIWDHAANHTGHAPRMNMMDRTEKAVHAVMHAATQSRNRDIAVGWKTNFAYAVNWLFPRFSTRLASNIVHRHQIKLSPPAVDTPGNLFTPSQHNSIETDIKERMRKEKYLRKNERNTDK